jgi:hypothetical protein
VAIVILFQVFVDAGFGHVWTPGWRTNKPLPRWLPCRHLLRRNQSRHAELVSASISPHAPASAQKRDGNVARLTTGGCAADGWMLKRVQHDKSEVCTQAIKRSRGE